MENENKNLVENKETQEVVTEQTDKSKNLHQSFPKPLLLALLIAVVLIGAFAGFFGVQLIIKPKVTIVETPDKSSISSLPENLKILSNPMLADWSANVKGKIVKKTDTYFELMPIEETYGASGLVVTDVTEGKLTRVLFYENKTTFHLSENVNGQQKLTPVRYDALSEGTILRGNVQISYNDNRYDLIGNVFNINKNE